MDLLLKRKQNTDLLEEQFFSSKVVERSYAYLQNKIDEHRAFKPGPQSQFNFRDLSQNFWQVWKIISKAIQEGSYQIQTAKQNEIFVDKKRIIYHFEWIDHFVMTHLALCIQELIEPRLTDNLYSFRKGRGAYDALSKLSSFIKTQDDQLFILKRDIKQYGESMQHTELFKLFESLSSSSQLLQLFKEICRFPYCREDTFFINESGLPTGSYIQIVFENLYLSNLDQSFDDRSEVFYSRFGDDILVATAEQELANSADEEIARFISSRGLELKHAKSENILLLAPEKLRLTRENSTLFGPSDHFEYLGARNWFNGSFDLPTRKLRRARQLLKKRVDLIHRRYGFDLSPDQFIDCATQLLQNIVENQEQYEISAITNYLRFSKGEAQLRELDQWLALYILRLAFRKKSTKKSLFKLKSFKELRRRGLPSLVHERRIGNI